MFNCRSCTLRAIRAFSIDVCETTLAHHGRRWLPHTQTVRSRYASTDSISTNSPGEKYYNAAQLRHMRRMEGDEEESDARPALQKADAERAARIQTKLKKEIVWLQDPVKLAARVDAMLVKGEVEPALELVRMASRDMSCTVSWNHCINWHMANGQPKMATRIFNDMKKRGQAPDSLTYMLLLRGFVRGLASDPLRERLAKATLAVSLYNSMKAPNSKVSPSILHTNAVLRVCAVAGAQDHLWGIVGGLPEKGPHSPDHVTYTVILSAIFHSAKDDFKVDNLSERQLSMRKVQAVDEGRRVWRGVVQRWRAGQIVIDEQLVFIMARILLLSPSVHDWDEVFNLVEQTTGIRRQVSPVGTAGRSIEHLPDQAESLAQLREMEDEAKKDPGEAQDSDVAASMRVFHPVKHEAPGKNNRSERNSQYAYVRPGNKILSVLTEACGMMRLAKVSSAYWDMIVKEFQVEPDVENLNAQLGNYRLSRASASAAALIASAAKSSTARPSRRSYWKALCACLRNKKSPSALEHADQIIAIMRTQLAQPSEAALTEYLRLAESTKDDARMLKTLDRVEDFLPNIRAQLAYGEDDATYGANSNTHARFKDTAELLRRWLMVIQTLQSRRKLDKEGLKVLRDRRGRIGRLASVAKRRLQLLHHDLKREKSSARRGSVEAREPVVTTS